METKKEYGLFFEYKHKGKLKVGRFQTLFNKEDIISSVKLKRKFNLYPEVIKWFIKERTITISKWGEEELLK